MLYFFPVQGIALELDLSQQEKGVEKMYILIVATVVLIGIVIILAIFYPAGKEGYHAYSIYRPKESKKIDYIELDIDVFEKMGLSSVCLSQTLYDDEVVLLYTGVDQQGRNYSAERRFFIDNHLVVSSVLKGKRLVVETEKNFEKFYDYLFMGGLISVLIGILFAFIVYIVSESYAPCYGW